MAVTSDRIRERATADFGPRAFRIVTRLEQLDVSPGVDAERLHAAILIAARANLSMIDDAFEHAASDWRDLLDRAGLAGDDWRDQLDGALGRA
ncbi:hypothetical protein [uncultured Demequina sp.]|uniref:hypothetical protein n=1 Tax=uncultured Demequina sp. TaxID=693499 RepID=UPI0025EE59A1|nr:hypothetical protein [uncultured Demequina sp.]